MTARRPLQSRDMWLLAALLVALLGGSGCQTFPLSQEESSQQQQGDNPDEFDAGTVDFRSMFLDVVPPDDWRPPDER